MKNLNSSVRINEKSFHLLYDEIPIGIGYCSSSGNVMYVNPKYLSTLGLNNYAEIIGYNIFDNYNFSRQEVELIQSSDDYSFRSQYVVPADRFPTSKAPVLSLNVKISRVSGTEGQTIGFMVYLIDHTEVVNERMKKELELTRKSKAVIDNLPIEYFRCKLCFDSKGQIEDFIALSGNKKSEEAYNKFGLKWGETRGSDSLTKSDPTILVNLNKLRESGVTSGKFRSEAKEIGVVKDVIVVFEDDEFVNIICFDVTALIRAERMKSQFVSNMSHEIRTPLNAIVGFSQLLGLPEGFITEDERKQYAEYISNNSSLLTMLIDDILDLSDVENGTYRIEKSDVSCNSICTKAINTVCHRAQPGVKMSFTTTLDDSYMINTDPRRVQQVLINFLTNACKHTKEGEINLHCTADQIPGKIVFSVTDTGTGIPEDKVKAIFDRFVKIDPYVQGTGLGLSICKTIAELLGGEVGVDTSYTKGARFYFVL